MQDEWTSPDGRIRLINADCLAVLPHVEADALVTDPPYGIGYDPVRSQESAASGVRKPLDRVRGDDVPFDPTPLLGIAPRMVIWGANNFASRLPDAGGWLVWDKREGGSTFRGFQMSDCELAWCNVGRMVRTISHRWCGHLRDSERNNFVHPTQKPVVVMSWCLEQCKTPADGLVFDPYAGSFTTAIACIRTGRRFIGCEIEPRYFKTGIDRCKAEYSRTVLFNEAEAVA
jgi:site-specific DNA-methyltransferase (adenine-specific)